MRGPTIPQWLRRPYVIDTVDPHGTRVICSRSWWIQKITSKHVELWGQQKAVASVIEDPERIYQSSTHPKRRIFYRSGILPAPYDRAWLRVVVEYPTITFDSRPPAAVITAFTSTNLKEGEVLLWPLPSNLPAPQ